MKKNSKYILIIFLLMFGIYNVKAKNYNPGDKIKVHVNDSTISEFYVVSDNGDTITAISNGYIQSLSWNYDGSCLLNNSLINVRDENDWTNRIGIVTFPDISDIIKDQDILNDIDSLNSTLFSTNNQITLQESQVNDLYSLDDNKNVMMYVYPPNMIDNNTCYAFVYIKNADGTKYLRKVDKSDANKYGIKLLADFNKEFVESIQNEEQSQENLENLEYLKNFVNQLKNSTLIKALETSGAEVNFFTDDVSLVINYIKDGSTHVYSLYYDSTNHILSDEIGNGSSNDADELKIKTTIIDSIIATYCEINGYDEEDFYKWLFDQYDLNPEKDGISINLEEITTDNGEKQFIYNNFAINIKDGVKTYIPSKTQVEINDEINKSDAIVEKTVNVDNTLSTISTICFIISGLLIVIGLSMYLYNLKKIKNNN